MTVVRMQLGPALLANQSNYKVVHQSSTEIRTTNTETVVVSSRKDDTMLSDARAMRPSLSVTRVYSPLERIGIYQRKIVRRMPCSSQKTNQGRGKDQEIIISEDHETTLLWGILGYGLTWIQCRSFGKAVPSLSTFPVVSSFSEEIFNVFENGEMQDFQDMLCRGEIHPFSHNAQGRSLLHVRSSAYLVEHISHTLSRSLHFTVEQICTYCSESSV